MGRRGMLTPLPVRLPRRLELWLRRTIRDLRIDDSWVLCEDPDELGYWLERRDQQPQPRAGWTVFTPEARIADHPDRNFWWDRQPARRAE